MKYYSLILLLALSSSSFGQMTDFQWYSQSNQDGIVIQNSFPKGGPYLAPTTRHFNYSYLVFFSRILNESDKPIDISIKFSSDSVQIPNSPDTYMKLFLPSQKMSWEKRHAFSYGITSLHSFNEPTSFQKKLMPGEDVYFYTVAIFYQTKASASNQDRGGNRIDYSIDENNLIVNLNPQVKDLQCGWIRQIE